MNEELNKLIERGKRAIYKSNTKKYKKEMTNIEAMAYVLCRLDNIRRHVKENILHFPKFPTSYQLNNIAHHAGLKWNEDLIDKDLREMEKEAGLPEGSAGYGTCMRCGRTLTDPDSVKAGIGPICINKKPGEK